jgi:uncharacterized membrane protein
LYNINFSNIWIDEAFTKALVKHSFGDITGFIKNDFHPPLYFYGLKIFVSVFGISVFTIRLFSVLGALATIFIGYAVGQKVFGKSGALYFCLLLLSLPMLAEYSHEARMYTWGAFTVTGVFLYAVLFITSNRRQDLLFLMLFSLIAAYTHYYALLAAFWANIFVFLFLFFKRNENLKVHSIYSLAALLLYLPWLLVMLRQTTKVSKSFWVPALDWQIIVSCLLSPFAPKIYLPPFLPLAVIIYGLILWVIYRNYISRKEKQDLTLGLSLCMFGCTILSVLLVSVLMQPILYMRYIANIIVLILIPVTLFFISIKNKWVKGVVLITILILGINVSIEGSFFSFGPYEQSLNYLHKKHPEVKKVIHVLETTAGPFAEYSSSNIENYWYNPDSTIVYTNMDVFSNLLTTDSHGKVLRKDEPFCVVNFPYMPFNENNFNRILSDSQIIKVDTVVDNKVKWGGSLLLFVLKYKGIEKKSL